MLFALVLLVGGSVWAGRHISLWLETAYGARQANSFNIIYTLAFLLLVWQTVLAYLEKPYKVTNQEWEKLLQNKIVVNVPLRNEDPDVLRACLWSFLDQSVLPDIVEVVENGNTVDYGILPLEWVSSAHGVGLDARWVKNKVAGKRRAQVLTFLHNHNDSDIDITVDSDTVLDDKAIEEIIKPFANPKVMSVAGVGLALNATKNFLTRMTDLWFVTNQLVDRSAMSTMGSVLVNSGVLAAYRHSLIQQYGDAYANETFRGKPVEFSDDSMLTTYALLHGKAVQQPTAIALTMFPENWNHHKRQQLRWMRGAAIRTLWRFRYLPVNSYVYWMHFATWANLILSTVIFIALFIVQPVVEGRVLPWLLTIPVFVGYTNALRYFAIRRSDMSVWSQLLSWLLSPIATLWNYVVLRPVRFWAIATCMKTDWGTREQVEVTLQSAQKRQRRLQPRYALLTVGTLFALSGGIASAVLIGEQAKVISAAPFVPSYLGELPPGAREPRPPNVPNPTVAPVVVGVATPNTVEPIGVVPIQSVPITKPPEIIEAGRTGIPSGATVATNPPSSGGGEGGSPGTETTTEPTPGNEPKPTTPSTTTTTNPPPPTTEPAPTNPPTTEPAPTSPPTTESEPTSPPTTESEPTTT